MPPRSREAKDESHVDPYARDGRAPIVAPRHYDAVVEDAVPDDCGGGRRVTMRVRRRYRPVDGAV